MDQPYPSTPTQKRKLTYAPPAAWYRRPFTGRLVTLACALLFVIVALLWAPRCIRWARLLNWERQCLSYPNPPRVICSVENPDDPATSDSQIQRTEPPECWKRFYSAISGAGIKSEGTVFLHERRAPSGASRLIAIDTVVQQRDQIATGISFYARSFARPGRFSYPKEVSSLYYGKGNAPGFIAWHDSARVFAGRIDPENPSHFTMDVEIDGRRQTIDGWITDNDEDILLQERADTLIPSAPPSAALPR